jgi:lysine 2,3-aminomutase
MHRPAVLRSEVDEATWNDWRWQLRSRVDDPALLAQLFELTDDERAGLAAAPGLFRIGITPYYLGLADRQNPFCPVRMQVIPTGHETKRARGEMLDPLGEDAAEAATGLVHRYPDRVLFLALNRCAIYCRHCNRRRMVGHEEHSIAKEDLDAALEAIRADKRIKDVLISGGDPFTMSTDKLEWVVSEVRKVRHVDIIRIGTRVPVCLPMRVDQELARMLARYHPLYVNTHFNHPKEITDEAKRACAILADAGIPLGNQAVLMRRLNSSVRTIRRLLRELLKIRVRPYYLFLGDPAFGTDHLRTPVGKGVELMEAVRGHMSGMAVPHLVIDAPGGGGKIPIGPQYVMAWGADRLVLRNYEGKLVTYHEPAERDCSVPYDEVFFAGEPGDEVDDESRGVAAFFDEPA